jgi:hypothetical protein
MGRIVHNQERAGREQPGKKRDWWPIIIAAIIGAIATIVAAVIANRAGALNITIAPAPPHTVTITSAPSSTVAGTVSSGGGSAAEPGAFLYSETNVTVPDEGNLTYKSAVGNQLLFTSWNSLGYITAGANVNLAVLNSAPTANAAYQACEKDVSYKQRIMLNSLPVGSTLCAFTPNDQVIWIRFSPANSSSNSLQLSLISWQGPKS